MDQLPADKLSAYIRNITHLSVHGLPHLFVTDPTVLSVQDDTTGLQQSPAEVLHRSCVSFLVSLCSLQGGDLLLKTHCVSPLLSTLSEECNGSSTVSPGESRPFQVLGAIARECRMPAATDSSYEESLLTVVAPRLLAVIKTSIADCNTGT